MRTEHLDNKINELETLRSRGELTYMGGEMLSEFNEIKQALTIPVVSSSLPNESELTAEEETRKEKFEHDLRWEENRGNDF
tara:strand:- start:678 stop:920 length:243 start_codon:yes stop_codon:yes gene_type:complete